jgi:uncharacterized membrane protein
MIVILLLLGSTLLFRAAGALGVAALATWQDSTRWGLAAMLLFAASAHFTAMREDLIRMVPPSFPRPDLIVTLTGVLEVLAAVGMLVPATRRLAGVGLILLLVAMLPANISAALRGVTLAGKPVTGLWLRIPMQALFVGLAWWTTQPAQVRS